MSELPPQRRTELGTRFTTHANAETLVLPRCRDCGAVQYPLRERCKNCLGDALDWVPVPMDGVLLSWTRLHASAEPYFRARLPLLVGRVKLACRPVVIAHLDVPEPRSRMELQVKLVAGSDGAAVLVATADGAQTQ